MSPNRLLIALIYIVCMTFASCGVKNQQNDGAVWGTTYHISYRSDRDLGDSIVATMRRVELEFSMFDKQSTVSRINRNDAVVLSDEFISLFNLAKETNAISGGAFDPTVGPLTDLWGFGTKDVSNAGEPTQTEIDSALLTVGIDSCHIADRRMIKKHDSTRFDFSSIAKGYGVDAVAAMLRRNGCENFLVEIGGEVITSGVNPDGREWHIQIDAPVEDRDDPSHSPLYLIVLNGRAVATSGNYRNYRDVSGGRIGHTLDPRSGHPVTSPTVSATVIAGNCALADALATACMVMPAEKAMEMIERLDKTEALIAVSEQGALKLLKSSGFPESLQTPTEP